MRKFWSWIRDDGGGRILRLEGPIDEESYWSDGVTPKAFRDDLYAEDGDVTIYIRSPGGNVFAAAEIYTMIRDYPGSVTVKIDAIAASAASVIAMAGDHVMISPVGMLMIHDPITIAIGNSQEMEKVISTLNEVKESIVNAYQAKTGLSRNKIAKLMADETWMNAKKAVELGFADEIMFGDKKSEPEAVPEEQEDGEQDGGDAPKEGQDGEKRIATSNAAEAMEGLLYSTRTMGQRILNTLGAFDGGKAPDTGSARNEGEADGKTEESEKESDAEREDASEREETAEDVPEGEAETVEEDSTAEEESVTEGSDSEEQAPETTATTTDAEEQTADTATTTDTEEQTADTADTSNTEAQTADMADTDDQTGTVVDSLEACRDEKTEPSVNILPEGFIAIDQNGRTPDGSVPYIVLRRQLDRMR